jgi:cell division protease FtsH
MFVGVGAARVRDLFEQARQKAPVLVDRPDKQDRVQIAQGNPRLIRSRSLR